MIECVTYRLSVHTTADDPSVYRDEEEVEKWRERDPIPRFQKYLGSRDLISDDDLDELEEEIAGEIDEAWERANDEMESLGDPVDMFDHVYAEPPAYLAEQRASLTGSPEAGEEE